jgi:hypothetical protein
VVYIVLKSATWLLFIWACDAHDSVSLAPLVMPRRQRARSGEYFSSWYWNAWVTAGSDNCRITPMTPTRAARTGDQDGHKTRQETLFSTNRQRGMLNHRLICTRCLINIYHGRLHSKTL